MQNEWWWMADGKMQLENADNKMRITKCGRQNRAVKMWDDQNNMNDKMRIT